MRPHTLGLRERADCLVRAHTRSMRRVAPKSKLPPLLVGMEGYGVELKREALDLLRGHNRSGLYSFISDLERHKSTHASSGSLPSQRTLPRLPARSETAVA